MWLAMFTSPEAGAGIRRDRLFRVAYDSSVSTL